jgi:1-deoxy-D-xylulose-5-phosphate reductoisomerase
MKGIVVLGSTGSIGTQTLDVVRALPERLRVVGLAAGNNTALLTQQVAEFRPAYVHSGAGATIDGPQAVSLEEMATLPEADVVMMALTGKAGLEATLAALRAGKAVALSDKEVIVMAGGLVMRTAAAHGAQVLPVDSEPSAIWQCIQGETQPVRRLIITASGGPFRTRSPQEIATVTPEQALRHPTWVMGRKITIDSSTLMNKGFEVIESRWLFDVPYERIEVVVHPQSVVHSFVELADGSVKAQMGPPDMRLPIQYALTHPERVESPVIPRYDPLAYPSLTFEPLDPVRHPCFATALEAGRAGGTHPAVLSAADEEAVHLFLDGRIGFGDIPALVARVVERHEGWEDDTVEAVLAADAWARAQVGEWVGGRR